MVPMVGPVAGWLEGHAQHSNLGDGEVRSISIMIHDIETDTTDRAGCMHLSDMLRARFRACGEEHHRQNSLAPCSP